MFIDARKVENGSLHQAEVCIVGGGMAGLTIALELEKRRISTLVLESGGFEPDEQTRDLHRGISLGLPYRFGDGCRSRYLGGSSNCWGGWCRPLQAHDFDVRDWVPYSGWPISLADLAPFYSRAHRVLELGPENYDPAFWASAVGRKDTKRFPLSGNEICDAISQFSPPLRMGHAHRRMLKNSRFISVCLYANVVDILTDPQAGSVSALSVRTLTGRSFSATAGVFVLAAGGIETARLLLASNATVEAGLGNEHGLVGRFFMDHPRVTSGTVRFKEGWQRQKLYDHKFHYQNPKVAAHGVRIAAQFAPSPEAQRAHGLLNSQVWFASKFPGDIGDKTPVSDALVRTKHRLERKEIVGHSVLGDFRTLATNPVDSIGFISARLFQPQILIRRVRMQAIVEPAPDPMSRVTLSDQLDRLGMRRVTVDWRLGEQVKRTFDRTFELLARELDRIGVATVELDPPIEGGEWPSTFEYEGSWHHMGTTRMHDSPRSGVVDRSCRVHSLKNLYVAGSAVFPTGGANFPSITIVALALRLADRIPAELGGRTTQELVLTPREIAAPSEAPVSIVPRLSEH